jgi:catechol-2,3-dioxygenase
MVENRTLLSLAQLEEWLRHKPRNVAISYHWNSLRPIRQVSEHLGLSQMLRLGQQDRPMAYALHLHGFSLDGLGRMASKANWTVILVPRRVRLATDP